MPERPAAPPSEKCKHCHLAVKIRQGMDAANPFDAIYDGQARQYCHTYCYQKQAMAPAEWSKFRAGIAKTPYGVFYRQFEAFLQQSR